MYKIAISGKAGSGKNTLSKILYFEMQNLLSYKHEVSYENIAFADPIKEIILHMYPKINRNYLFGSSLYRNEIIMESFKDDKPLSIRQLLQDLGEGMKQYNPKIWINALDNKVQKFIKDKIDLVVVSDLRFIDEFNYLKNNGFYLIRLIRDDSSNINHISEIQQNQIKNEEFDSIIFNDGSLEDLSLQVEKVVKLLNT